MHPQIQLPEPGSCPICGMDLIPLENPSGGDEGPRTLTLSPTARKIAAIQTSAVVRREVSITLRMAGKLEVDETRVREISAWVPGRIDRLYIDYTGVPVRRGEKLFDLYSPQLYTAQEELLQAISTSHLLSRSTLESTRRSAERTIHAARERLRLWGVTRAQIEAIEGRGTPSDHVSIVAPISGVVLHKDAVEGSYVQTGTHVYAIAELSVLWLKLDVYESDLSWVKLGQTVEFETDTYPGEGFRGEVAFVDPLLDERSRTVKVRVNVENTDGRVKPGMFARAALLAKVEGIADQPPLVIPASAPLLTGTRAVVYVEDPDEVGRFHGREIELGPRAGEFYVVHAGLEEGERVVSNGSFKIDSALQILAKKSMMNAEAGMPPGGHDHGPSAAGEATEPMAQIARIEGVPALILEQFDEVVARYMEIGGGLSHDDFGHAQTAAKSFGKALLEVNGNILPLAGQDPWAEAKQALESAARSLAGAADLAQARLKYHGLSTQMIHTVRAFGASGRRPVLLYHCPMAMDGAGADWLQSSAGTENPYYGSMMFRCGSQTEVLVALSVPDGHDQH